MVRRLQSMPDEDEGVRPSKPGPKWAGAIRSSRSLPRAFGPWAVVIGLASAAATGGAESVDPRRDALVEAVEKAMPSVVNIATQKRISRQDRFEELLREFWDPFYRRRSPESPYNLGSGVVISPQGYLLTNNHLVQRADRILVKFVEDEEEHEAVEVARDPATDLALLRITSPEGGASRRFQPITFERPDDLYLGETVLALGNPFGLGGSVSHGILSSKNRRPPTDEQPLAIEDWLQTDAAINPGNSGGPLINMRGNLIGLNVAIFRQAQGIGFAIPVKRIYEALSEMFTPETLGSLWFGARLEAASTPLKVRSVTPDSPADEAGLQPGDRIVRLDDQTPENYLRFVERLVAAGTEPIGLTFQRDGAARTTQLSLLPEEDHFNEAFVRQRLGVSVQPLTAELARQFRLRSTQGLLIADVAPGSRAAETGLEPGWIIQGIDGEAVDGVVEAAKILDQNKGDAVVLDLLIQVRRGNRLFTLERQARLQVE